MADLKLLAARRKAERFEAAGLADQAKAAKARLAELEKPDEGLSMANTKDELLEAATAAGVETDEGMTKAEILKALESE
jgi:hypothetical protein